MCYVCVGGSLRVVCGVASCGVIRVCVRERVCVCVLKCARARETEREIHEYECLCVVCWGGVPCEEEEAYPPSQRISKKRVQLYLGILGVQSNY